MRYAVGVTVMLVLAKKPRDPRASEHYVAKTDGVRHALCSSSCYPHEGARLKGGAKWTVRESQPDDVICKRCQRKSLPLPCQLVCTNPSEPISILERADGKSLVHARDERDAWCLCHAASWYDIGWTRREGVAGEVTCERCLKSLGLHRGTQAKEHALVIEQLKRWTRQ